MILRTRAGDIRSIGRATQGVRLIEMDEGDAVVAIAKLAEKEEEEDGADPATTEPPADGGTGEPDSEPDPTGQA
jgi:DNA gyrase subunit A